MNIEEVAFKDRKNLVQLNENNLLDIIEFLQKDRKQWINQFTQTHNESVEIQKENQELKKQLEEYQQELEKADSITQSCIFNGKEESKISYRKCLNILDKKETQQKVFIKYLEDEIKQNTPSLRWKHYNEDGFNDYDVENPSCIEVRPNDKIFKEILKKYKEIIGDDKE